MKISLPVLRAKLLRALKPCGNYWLDEDTLHIQLNLAHPGVGRDEILLVLRSWKDKDYVDFRVDEISGLTEWRLTESGRKLAGKAS
jgi:hypothetical protein